MPDKWLEGRRFWLLWAVAIALLCWNAHTARPAHAATSAQRTGCWKVGGVGSISWEYCARYSPGAFKITAHLPPHASALVTWHLGCDFIHFKHGSVKITTKANSDTVVIKPNSQIRQLMQKSDYCILEVRLKALADTNDRPITAAASMSQTHAQVA